MKIQRTVETLPEDEFEYIKEALSPLPLLDDEDLWRAARSHLSAEIAEQLDRLHLKQQREGLTEAEKQTLNHLVRHYERTMLVRAQSARLLQERGYDVSTLRTSK